MGRTRLFLALALFAALPVACSSNDKTDSSAVDSGKKDTGLKDGSTADDTAVADTGSSGGDTSTTTDTGTPGTDSGGKTCDPHTGDECNMVKQDCADATATCVYDNTTKHNVCSKLTTGTKIKGESCASQSDCDRGLFCYSNKCSPPCCTGDNSVCGAGGECKLAITDDGGAVIYHACSYNAKCNPFKSDCPAGQVCLFSAEPDVFKCSSPSGSSTGTAPGGTCKYVNDCGESQACFSLTSGGDAASASTCMLFCWLTKPDGFSPSTGDGTRFPANGTCTVAGKTYGTCQSVGGIGGGLGVCVK